MAPVIKELQKHEKRIKIVTVATAQHREMLDQVLDIFCIRPEYNLNIMRTEQSIFDTTTRALTELKTAIEEERPDIVLVQGDITTTFAASLAAFYLQIPVGHIEAGLRTQNKYSPFPEEMNRHLTAALADLHFAPTEKARKNLMQENVPQDKIFVTGNTIIDALFWIVNRKPASLRCEEFLSRIMDHANNKRLILVTAHRRESFGKGLEIVSSALKRIADLYEDVEIIYPVHLNPHVKKPVNRILGRIDRIHLLDPLDYELFAQIMNRSYLILTDSGGIQEEAPSLRKPVLVLCQSTERSEVVEAGLAKVVGLEENKIVQETQRLLDDKGAYERMINGTNPYGDGKASKRIVQILLKEKIRV